MKVIGVLDMSPAELDEVSSYDPTDEKPLLRLSKSSLMNYRLCPRQYWWARIQLKDMRLPATPAMIRGSKVHDGLENLYENWDGQHHLLTLLPDDDRAFAPLADLEQQRLENWGIEHFAPDSFEEKMVVYDPDNEVVLVGKIDGVLVHPEGGLCLLELKTGKMNDSKLRRTRFELFFYEYLLKLNGETRPITHFAYLSPDCEDAAFVTKVMNQRGKEVLLGEETGVLIIEKVNNRSRTAFEKGFLETIDGIKNHEWPMKWNDYFCPQWCDFHLSCEAEITGIEEW
tara:strand:+ start:11594 stop:12448 length:855 start_codon:yes stop_codon:yes gene_type:complete